MPDSMVSWLAAILPAVVAWAVTMLAPIPESSWGKFWRGLILCAVAVIGGSGLWWYQRPSVLIEAGSFPPLVITSDDWVFARVRVGNESRTQDAFCRLFLTDIFKDGLDRAILHNEYILLAAANQPDLATERYSDQMLGP